MWCDVIGFCMSSIIRKEAKKWVLSEVVQTPFAEIRSLDLVFLSLLTFRSRWVQEVFSLQICLLLLEEMPVSSLEEWTSWGMQALCRLPIVDLFDVGWVSKECEISREEVWSVDRASLPSQVNWVVDFDVTKGMSNNVQQLWDGLNWPVQIEFTTWHLQD